MDELPLYSEIELASFLPPGWRVADAGAGRWDRKKNRWTIEVLDGCAMDWELSVVAGDVGRVGRIEALRAAVDQLHRLRLG